MSVAACAMASFVATLVLTTIMAGAQELRLTRMSLPLLLGTLVTPDRDLARIAGFFVHLANGFVFALAYVGGFHLVGRATPLLGAAAGLLHALVVLLVAIPALPAIHPRMASETSGPTVTRQLEPPGALARHYGIRTPVVVVLAHLAYGALLGALYPLP